MYRIPQAWNWHWNPGVVFHNTKQVEEKATNKPEIVGQPSTADLSVSKDSPYKAWIFLQHARSGSNSSSQGLWTARMQQFSKFLSLAAQTYSFQNGADVTFAELGVDADATMSKVAHAIFPQTDINYIDPCETAGAKAIEDLERNCHSKLAHFDLVTEACVDYPDSASQVGENAGVSDKGNDDDEITSSSSTGPQEFLPGNTPFAAIFIRDSLAYASQTPYDCDEKVASRCVTKLFRLAFNSLTPGGEIWIAERDNFLTSFELLELITAVGFDAEILWSCRGQFLCSAQKPFLWEQSVAQSKVLSQELETAISLGNFLEAHRLQQEAQKLLRKIPGHIHLNSDIMSSFASRKNDATNDNLQIDKAGSSNPEGSQSVNENHAPKSTDSTPAILQRQFIRFRRAAKHELSIWTREKAKMIQRQRALPQRKIRSKISAAGSWWREYQTYIKKMEIQLRRDTEAERKQNILEKRRQKAIRKAHRKAQERAIQEERAAVNEKRRALVARVTRK